MDFEVPFVVLFSEVESEWSNVVEVGDVRGEEAGCSAESSG